MGEKKRTLLFQDLNLDTKSFLVVVLQSLYGALIFIYAIIFLFWEDAPFLTLFNTIEVTGTGMIAFIIFLFSSSFFLSGFIIDRYHNLHQTQKITNFICMILCLLIFYVPTVFQIAITLLVFFVPFTIMHALNIFMSQTSILNRGRYIAFCAVFLSIIGIPFLAIIVGGSNSLIFLTTILVALFCLNYFWASKYILPIENLQKRLDPLVNEYRKIMLAQSSPSSDSTTSPSSQETQNENIQSEIRLEDLGSKIVFFVPNVIKKALKTLNESGLFPYLMVCLILYFALGFSVAVATAILEIQVLGNQFLILVVILTIVTGVFIDFYGRKTTIVATSLIIGTILIVMGNISEDTFQILWIYSFPFVLVSLFMFSFCIVGDLSNIFRRGRLWSIMLYFSIFSLVIGYALGFFTQVMENENKSIITEDTLIISDILTIAVLIAFTILVFAPETIDTRSLRWRRYPDRLYFLTKQGISLFNYHFNYDNPADGRSYAVGEDTNDELMGGSLAGVQMLLKELSKSKKNLEVLDHSDQKIIFSHGDYTTFVLFATDYLPIIHEKLKKIQSEFEFYNRPILEHFAGMIPPWKQLPELAKKYFDILPETIRDN